MTTATGILTDFLLARIAEDEQAAREPQWLALEYGLDSYGRQAFSARVLAECKAKLRVVTMHQHRDHSFGNSQAECPSMARPLPEAMVFRDRGGCDTLVALAAVYADHEDYRDEWRP